MKPLMRPRNNSVIPGYGAKPSELGTDEYITKVAAPIMDAVDQMPAPWRALVNEFGYIQVYGLWKRGLTTQQARETLTAARLHPRPAAPSMPPAPNSHPATASRSTSSPR